MKKPLSPTDIRYFKVRALKLERNARKRKKRKSDKRKKIIREYIRNKIFREMAKDITNYNQAINVFMPKNLRYLGIFMK